MHPLAEHRVARARGGIFWVAGSLGLGTAALASLLSERSLRLGGRWTRRRPASAAGVPGLPHFPPKAKRVIYLFQSGAPSQLDLFDYKPKLEKFRGQDLPESIRMGQRLTGMTSGQKSFPIAPSMFKFAQHGQSGAWISELMPHLADSGRRTVLRQVACTPRRSTTTRPSRSSTPARNWPAGRASGPGFRTAWGARTRTCRRS